MINEENLMDSMLESINNEIERLEKLRNEKEKLTAKAKVVIYSSRMVIEADGEISYDEAEKMQNYIFKKYHITDEVSSAYLFSPVEKPELSHIKELIEKHEIDKEFLEDLYTEILDELPDADGEVSSAEEEVMAGILQVFNLSSEDE